MSMARVASYQLMGPGLHQRPISWVKISKAARGSTTTSTLLVTASGELIGGAPFVGSGPCGWRALGTTRAARPRRPGPGPAMPAARRTGRASGGTVGLARHPPPGLPRPGRWREDPADGGSSPAD